MISQFTNSTKEILRDENFILPDMGEYMDNDLFESIIRQMDTTNKDPMYYVENPFSEINGYYPTEDVFVTTATPIINQKSYDYNNFDGDTISFSLDSIQNDKPFIIDDKEYSGVKDYIIKTRKLGSTSNMFSVRLVGINCPEIPHYGDIIYNKKYDTIIKIPFNDLKNNTSIGTDLGLYPISAFNFDKNGDPNRTVKFIYKKITKNDDPTVDERKAECFYEIVDDKETYVNHNDTTIIKKKIVISDGSEYSEKYNNQGIGARNLVYKLLNEAKDIKIVLDRNTLNLSGGELPEEYRKNLDVDVIKSFNPFYTLSLLYKLTFGNSAYKYLGYQNFGQDSYGRLLGAIYVKIKSDTGNYIWINLGKRIAMEFDLTKILPDYTGTGVSKYNFLSSAFKLWTYDMNKNIFVDSILNTDSEDRDDREKVQKEITGLDLNELSDHTMLLGDCLLLVPPTSIRVVSQTRAERISILRSKGSATKSVPKSERLIEMSLFFNNEHGINGIAIEQETPNKNEKMTYWMNGLRALVAQFKFTPFLPIHNDYINNVLNIEAVTLVSYNISSMENFPSTLQVNITLQEFNYRHYMPELEPPSVQLKQDIFTNMFATTINFPVMRYYYQRAIREGERIKDFEYNSKEYLESTLGSKTALQPYNNDFGNIDFYLANEEHLKKKVQLKLKLKKEALASKLILNDDEKKWLIAAGKMGLDFCNTLENDVENIFNTISNPSSDKHLFLQNIPLKSNINNILNSIKDREFSSLYHGVDYTDNSYENKLYIATLINESMVRIASNVVSKNPIIKDFNFYQEGGQVSDKAPNEELYLIYTIELKLDINKLESQASFNTIKTFIARKLQVKVEDIVKDNTLKLQYRAKFYNITNANQPYYKMAEQFSMENSIDYKFLKALTQFSGASDENINSDIWTDFTSDDELNKLKDSMDIEDTDSLKFDKYPMGEPIVSNINCSYNNIVSNISLKAVDGYAPQYTGGSDSVIDISFIADELTVNQINNLSRLAVQRLIDYRKVLTVCPLRIDCSFTRMLGINEVVIETIDINTVPNMPKIFTINMRLISVDRTIRNKEALRKLKDVNNAGITHSSVLKTRSMFDLKESLARAELYPDLELPTIEELEQHGFSFIKYKYDNKRLFPDPDFYFVYAHAYSSQIFRTAIINFFKDEKNKQRVYDLSGNLLENDSAKITLDLGKVKEDPIIINEQSKANYDYLPKKYNSKVESIIKQIDEPKKTILSTKNSRLRNNINKLNEANTLINQLNEYLDITTFNSFDINRDIKIPMKDKTNSALPSESNNNEETVVKDLKNIILDILSKPISNKYKTNIFDKNNKPKNIKEKDFISSIRTVIKDSAYKELLSSIIELLNIAPDVNIEKAYNDMINVFANMIFSAACSVTGEIEYDAISKTKNYMPTLYKYINNENTIDKIAMPLCLIENSGQGTSELTLASSVDEFKNGIMFGPYGIKKYSSDILEKFFNTPLSGSRLGFLDPYYNNSIAKIILDQQIEDDEASKRENEYINGILNDVSYGTHAFFRMLLVWFYNLLDNDIYIPSSIYLIGQIQDVINKSNKVNDTFWDNFLDFGDNLDRALSKLIFWDKEKQAQNVKDDAEIDAIVDQKNYALEKLKDQINKIKNNMNEYKYNLFNGLFCVTIMLTITDFDSPIYEYVKDGRMSEFKTLTDKIKTSFSSKDFNSYEKIIRKFMSVLNKNYPEDKIDIMDDIDKLGKNNKYKKIFLNAAETPFVWLMHSFYDMVKYDMRGRMARAFPTYYMLLIDEGREVGLWKMHDNFYNMSSIVEFEIVKSRKIAADTAKIVLTNLYGTFSSEDEDAKDEYNYTFKEVWDSLWSPRKYFQQIENRDLNDREINRAKIVPGARIHLRMGYGSNAADLPIVFNGSVAEVQPGEVLTLIAQGDGIELSNSAMFNPSDSENAEDLKYADSLPVLRTLKEWGKNKATPRELLINPLVYRGTFVNKIIRNWSKGRFFNSNPFGIVHFGDPLYKDIFNDYGEVCQNIYQAINKPTWTNDVKVNSVEYNYSLSEAPQVQIPLQNKSYWDIMHICASISPDFITSIIPFGLRSSIFYGAPRYYCAYDYELAPNGEIVEKRKPFQQYHIYTSYTDIIGNTIAASDREVRTCAIGYYNGPGNIGTKIQSVGPLFVDIDIYPEKQKMTTIDCDFKYKGTDLPFTVPFVDNMLDEWSKNGGHQIAWRATASGLKNTIKDMYSGELIVMGDPSVKPYDKIMIDDEYEGIRGTCEVETVIHRLTPDLGFTSSITPDCISSIDGKYDQISGLALKDIIAPAIIAHTALCITNNAFYNTSRPAFMAIRQAAGKGSNFVENLVKSTFNIAGQENVLNNASIADKILKPLDIALDISPLDIRLFNALDRVSNYSKMFGTVDKITSTVELTETLSILSKATDNIDKLNPLSLELLIKEISTSVDSKLVSGAKDAKAIAEATESINAMKAAYNAKELKKMLVFEKKEINAFISTIEAFIKKNPDKLDDAAKIALSSLKNVHTTIDASKNAKHYKQLLENMTVLSRYIDDFSEAEGIVMFANKATDSIKSLRNGFKFLDKSADGFKSLNNIKKVATGFTNFFMSNVFWILAEIVITKTVQEYFERQMKNLQVLTIYPMLKDGMPLVAGLDGNKGSVFGSPTYNTPGMIEQWLIDLFAPKKGLVGFASEILKGLFVTEEMNNIVNNFKRDNGYSEANMNFDEKANVVQNSLLQYMSEQKTLKFSEYKALYLNNRIGSLSSDEAKYSFLRYSLSGIKNIESNLEISQNLIPIEDSDLIKRLKKNNVFKLAHEINISNSNIETMNINIPKGYSNEAWIVPTKYDKSNNVYDIPFLRTDSLIVLIRLIEKIVQDIEPGYEDPSCDFKNMKDKNIIFHNGTRINDSKGWFSTGYCFTIEVKNYNNLSNIIEEMNKEQKEIIREGAIDNNLFQFSKRNDMGENTYSIFVACPI